jgi:hypothetical protein
MRYEFTLIYELDTTVACAVAAYLDVEHYTHLHSKYSPEWQAIEHQGRRVKVEQMWRFAGLKVAQSCWTEYDPPARFLNFEIMAIPWWRPSVHHFMKTRTELHYYPTASGQKTISHLRVQLDLPIWLWPFRHVIEKRLCDLKREKDEEDMVMIRRREKIFGRGNINSYLMDHQFMLHKDDFVAHFGARARRQETQLNTAEPVPVSASR